MLGAWVLLKPTQNQPVRPQALASDSFEVFVPICFGDVDPNLYVCLDFLGKVNNITYEASSGCCFYLVGGSSACLMINHIKRYQEILSASTAPTTASSFYPTNNGWFRTPSALASLKNRWHITQQHITSATQGKQIRRNAHSTKRLPYLPISPFRGFHSHGGTPFSLDGWFHGKSIYKWMMNLIKDDNLCMIYHGWFHGESYWNVMDSPMNQWMTTSFFLHWKAILWINAMDNPIVGLSPLESDPILTGPLDHWTPEAPEALMLAPLLRPGWTVVAGVPTTDGQMAKEKSMSQHEPRQKTWTCTNMYNWFDWHLVNSVM